MSLLMEGNFMKKICNFYQVEDSPLQETDHILLRFLAEYLMPTLEKNLIALADSLERNSLKSTFLSIQMMENNKSNTNNDLLIDLSIYAELRRPNMDLE